MKKIVALASLLALTGVPSVKAESLTWEKYAQSPGGLAAIAAGIAMIGGCYKPYEFEQRSDGNTTSVSIHCKDKNGETSAIIQFEQVPGTRHLIPRSFHFAG